jgi:murein DD-endopeptidase MepM/ murein hydrolase activator NlpD
MLLILAPASMLATDNDLSHIKGFDGTNQLVLPSFKLPYKATDNVRWTGGPHQYGNLNTCASVPAGEGSGLDFASVDNPHFEVLAIADGEVIDAGCGEEFGCQVVIKHDVGGTVAIYGHLLPNSIPNLITANLPVNVTQGTILGKAGSSGTDNVHLHLELRTGGEGCPPGNCLYGGPVGWGDLVPFVDGWRIASYFKDGEGLEIWNYDGSAVREDAVKVLYDFPYFDLCNNRTTIHRLTIARVDADFVCPDGSDDCEVYEKGAPTQFAGKGSSQFVTLQSSDFSALTTIEGGWLTSSNTPVYPTPQPPPSSDSATFISDITLPDGSVVSPGQALVKTWRMQNTGSTTWGSGYQLVFISGEQMGGSTMNVPTTPPGSTVDLSVNITAPTLPGEYWGNWRLRNPNGTYFGPTIWVKSESTRHCPTGRRRNPQRQLPHCRRSRPDLPA